jgi:phenylalanyl-tRNA synthetase beta chain
MNLSYKSAADESYTLQRLISEQLTGCGFNEIMNNSQTSDAFYRDLTTYPAEHLVRLMNPLSSDLNVMRQTLLMGGLQSIIRNINYRQSDLRFYEFGNCQYFDAEKHAAQPEVALAGFREESHLALWLTGNRVSSSWAHPDEQTSVFEMKAAVLNILKRLGLAQNLRQKQFHSDIYAVGLELATQTGKVLAQLGIVSHKILHKFDIEQEVCYAEMDWNVLMKEAARVQVSYSDIAKFPPVRRDLALLVDEQVQFADIEKVAYDTDRKLLKAVNLFDVYEGKNLPAGKKSYAISLTLQDVEKTLQEKQIEVLMSKFIKNFETKLGATLR